MCISSQINTYYRKHSTDGRVAQGDILKDIIFIDWNISDSDPKKYKYDPKDLPYVVILSQDCDLLSDYNNRKDPKAEKHDAYLQSILVCPAYSAADLRKGTHLEYLGLIMEKKNHDKYSTIKDNLDPRYHYLPGDPEVQNAELVVDFKHYYTLPVSYLYKIFNEQYVSSLNELFRESLCQRFSFYLSRIGLPKILQTSDSESDPPPCK